MRLKYHPETDSLYIDLFVTGLGSRLGRFRKGFCSTTTSKEPL